MSLRFARNIGSSSPSTKKIAQAFSFAFQGVLSGLHDVSARKSLARNLFAFCLGFMVGSKIGFDTTFRDPRFQDSFRARALAVIKDF